MKLAAFAAIAALILWPVDAAAEPDPQSAKSPAPASDTTRVARDVESYIGDFARWSAAYDSVYTLQGAHFDALLDGMAEARIHSGAKNRKSGATWGRQWAAERRAELVTLRRTLDAVPAEPPPMSDFPPELRMQVESRIQAIAGIRPAIERSVTEYARLADDLIDVIEKTAAGDGRASGRLEGASLDLTTQALVMENGILEKARLVMDADHPEASAISAAQTTNLAVLAIMRLARAHAVGEKPEFSQLSAELRQRAAMIDVAASKAEQDARKKGARLQSNAAIGTNLLQVMSRALETYKETAAIDREIAASLVALGNAIEAPGETEERLEAALQTLEELGKRVEARGQITQSRRQMVEQLR